MRLHTIRQGRPGFTLIEMLVVMGLIILLAGIALTISYSGLIDNYKTVGAGDRASGWLLISKSRATREGAPRGVRFFFGANNRCTEAQYIEVPDPYNPVANVANRRPRLVTVHQVGSNPRVFVIDADLNDLINNVAIGDVLSISDAGTLHQIINFNNATITLANGTTIAGIEIVVADQSKLPGLGAAQTPASPIMTPSYTTTAFGFIRKARPMIGEPILQLTEGNVIDGNISFPAVATPFVDVLFAPNGEVLNTSGGKTIFWIRNPSFPAPTAGNRASFEQAGSMNLVTIYSKTGAIATQPVTLPPNPDPYAATKDGFNTGL